MNSSALIQWAGKIPFLSHGLRWYASQYAENSIVRIKHGGAAGFLWKRHHRYVNGYWLGHYELPIQEALRRELRAGETFFDIGADAGFFTLIAAKLVGPAGRCVAFDPAPSNYRAIREQIDANELNDYCVALQEAIGDHDGTATFSFSTSGSPKGHLGAGRKSESEILVKTLSLDTACERMGKPDFIRMDIEGGEGAALYAARHTIAKIRPRWLIELHGPERERQIRGILAEADYKFFDLEGAPLPATTALPQHFIARPDSALVS